MNAEQRDLLATFADGPKIWDAASLFKVVCDLENMGYVAFVGDGPKAEITEAGRAALAADTPEHTLIETPDDKYPHLAYVSCTCGKWKTSGAVPQITRKVQFDRHLAQQR